MKVGSDDPRGLKARLGAAQKRQQDLADFLGVELHVVSRIVTGKRKTLSADIERGIEAFFADLKSGSGGSRDALVPFDTHLDQRRSSNIPLYGFAAAGPDTPVHLNHDAVVGTVARHPAQDGRTGAFAVEVWGESMIPRHFPRERAYCLFGTWPAVGDDCLVELKNGDVYLKTYAGTRDGFVFTRQYNPDVERRFSADEVKALHAIVR